MSTGRNVIIFPASHDEDIPKGKGGKDGFFRDKLKVEEIEKIDDDLARTIRNHGYVKEVAFRGEKLRYKKRWARISPGDVAILRVKGVYEAAARILLTKESQNVADVILNVKKEYPLLSFFGQEVFTSAKSDAIAYLIGKPRTFTFLPADDERVEKIISLIGTI